MKTQKCTKCEVVLPLTEDYFYKHNNTKTGFHTQCKECVKAKQIAWRKDPNNREDCRLRASKHWHSKSQEERSAICNERRLMQRFKRTPEWYDATLKEQDGHCALCSFIPDGRRLHVDHSHECCPCEGTRYTCGKCIRSLLCDKCNTSLGYLEAVLKDALVFPMLGKDQSWTGRALRYLIDWEYKHKRI